MRFVWNISDNLLEKVMTNNLVDELTATQKNLIYM